MLSSSFSARSKLISPISAALRAGGLCVLLSLALRGGPRVLVFAAGTIGLAAVSLWAAWQPERYRALHSLLLPVPWAVFAIWLVRAGAAGDSGRYLLARFVHKSWSRRPLFGDYNPLHGDQEQNHRPR